MTLNRIKFLIAVVFTVLAAGLIALRSDSRVTFAAEPVAADTAATYKAQCAMCHSAKAEKFYDPAKPDEEHATIILKGKKGEKPPYMPGFESKGMKPEDAKALAEYMRAIRPQ